MEKLTQCKVCGGDLAKSAKACPHCGAPNRRSHPVLIFVCILLFCALCITAYKIALAAFLPSPHLGLGTDGSMPAGAASVEQVEEGYGPFGEGETGTMNGVKAAMVSVQESYGEGFLKPKDGNVFLIVTFDIENTTDKAVKVSNMWSFDAFADDYELKQSFSATTMTDEPGLSGSVEPGKKLRGALGFEARKDWQRLEVQFKPNYWQDQELLFECQK